MFAYAGTSREELEQLVDMLFKSAKKDRVAEGLGMKKTEHRDGWGFVVCSDLGCISKRFATAIFDEEDIRARIPPTSGRILTIFHARRRSKGPVGENSSQPFWSDTLDGTIYLAHNGSLEMDGLERDLGLTGVTDSEMVLGYAVRKGLPATVTDLRKYVERNSALNLLVLEKTRNGVGELYVNWYYSRDKTPGKIDLTKYYEMFHQRMPHGEAVFSSTLNAYGLEGEALPMGRLAKILKLN